jgi:hypothetical protein
MSVQKGVDFSRLSGVVGRRDQPHPPDKLEIHRHSLNPKQSIAKV